MRRAAIVLAGLCITPACGNAQTRFAVDNQTSLAWYQIDPHYNHLWATTCASDPSWQPGEGRDNGLFVNYNKRPKNLYDAGTSDKRIPLFPRKEVHPVCTPAVRGELTVADTQSWRGVKGFIAVDANKVEEKLRFRDEYARKYILETGTYPEITLTIDSISGVQLGDTVRAISHGVLQLHGVNQPILVPVKIWPDGGGLRVQGQWAVAASDLTKVYKMPRSSLMMGVVMGRWDAIYMGADLILKAQP